MSCTETIRLDNALSCIGKGAKVLRHFNKSSKVSNVAMTTFRSESVLTEAAKLRRVEFMRNSRLSVETPTIEITFDDIINDIIMSRLGHNLTSEPQDINTHTHNLLIAYLKQGPLVINYSPFPSIPLVTTHLYQTLQNRPSVQMAAFLMLSRVCYGDKTHVSMHVILS